MKRWTIALAAVGVVAALSSPLLLTAVPPVPAAATVGAPTCTGLAVSGSITADTAGQVVDGAAVSGGIRVTAPNVIIRNSCITTSGGDYYGIYVADGGSATITDTTITGPYMGAGLAGNNWSASRIDVSNVSDDATNMGNNTTLTDSYLHDFHPCSGCHSDGVQVFQLAGNVQIARNRIDVGTGNSAIILTVDVQQVPAVAGPVLISNNQFSGGTYTLHVVPDFHAQITGNVWLKSAWQWGPIYPDPAPATFTGNTLSDGTALCWPGTTCSPVTSTTTTTTTAGTTTTQPTTTTSSKPAGPSVLDCPAVTGPTVGQRITCTYK